MVSSSLSILEAKLKHKPIEIIKDCLNNGKFSNIITISQTWLQLPEEQFFLSWSHLIAYWTMVCGHPKLGKDISSLKEIKDGILKNKSNGQKTLENIHSILQQLMEKENLKEVLMTSIQNIQVLSSQKELNSILSNIMHNLEFDYQKYY